MPRQNKPKNAAPPNRADNADSSQTVSGLGVLRLLNQMGTNSSASFMRSQYSTALGYGFQGARDIYTGCGWSKNIQFAQFLAMFIRHPVGKAVVSRPVEGCWRTLPEVVESDLKKEETQFEKAWKSLTLNKSLKLFNKLRRADLLSGIGPYGVLFLGVDGDQNDLAQPVTSAKKLAYLTPLTSDHAEITPTTRTQRMSGMVSLRHTT